MKIDDQRLRYVLFRDVPGDSGSPVYVDRDEAREDAEHHEVRVACLVYECVRAFEITPEGNPGERWTNGAGA